VDCSEREEEMEQPKSMNVDRKRIAFVEKRCDKSKRTTQTIANLMKVLIVDIDHFVLTIDRTHS
jgi:hypothetical protein